MTSKKQIRSLNLRTIRKQSKFRKNSGSRKQRRNKKTLKKRLVGGGELLYGGTLYLVDDFSTEYETTFDRLKNAVLKKSSKKHSHKDTKLHTNNVKLCAAKLNRLYNNPTLTDPRAINQDKRTKLLAILNRCFTSSDPNFKLKEPHIWSDITPNNKIVDNYVTGRYNSPYRILDESISSKRASFLNSNPLLRLLSNCINVTRNDYVNVFNTEVEYDNESKRTNAFAPLLKFADEAHSTFINCYKNLRPNFHENYYELPLGRYSGWNSDNVDLFLYFFGDFEIYNIRINADHIEKTIKFLKKQKKLEDNAIIDNLFELYNKESIIETFLEGFRLTCYYMLKVLYSVKENWKPMKILPDHDYQNASVYTFNEFYKSIMNLDSKLPIPVLCDTLDMNLTSKLFIFYHNFFKINKNKNILNGTELNDYVETLKNALKKSEIYTENDVKDINNKKLNSINIMKTIKLLWTSA